MFWAHWPWYAWLLGPVEFLLVWNYPRLLAWSKDWVNNLWPLEPPPEPVLHQTALAESYQEMQQDVYEARRHLEKTISRIYATPSACVGGYHANHPLAKILGYDAYWDS